ncbi:MAG: hypothetical protein KAH06_08020, partial [Desulfobacterales bacterium]|nr:hypothetical protein [Desulfobacterales bacterium]
NVRMCTLTSFPFPDVYTETFSFHIHECSMCRPDPGLSSAAKGIGEDFGSILIGAADETQHIRDSVPAPSWDMIPAVNWESLGR